MTSHPKVFISYSHDNEYHKEWVRQFTDKLIQNGVDTNLDQYDLKLGDSMPHFMEREITNADYVLIICTKSYKTKADSRQNGVGYEGNIISSELFTTNNQRKFIPILREKPLTEVMPTFLSGKLGIDLSEDSEESFQDLLTTLFQYNRKPKLGNKPSYLRSDKNTKPRIEEGEEIKIDGIIADEVTVPSMDGTRGSALYAIPFQLNRNPSELWKKLFIKNWNNPPRWTSMHRPGIAHIDERKIILDGTTIEEVRDYHRETLKLVITKTNQDEHTILEKELQDRRIEEEKILNHRKKINSLSTTISFD